MSAATVLDPRLQSSNVPALPQDYISLPDGFRPSYRKFVGLLACQMNPLQKSLDTTITRIDKREIQVDADNGKPKKGEKKKSATAEASRNIEYEVECEDTVIFPEGGGQPCDQGTLTLISPDSHEAASCRVTAAFRRKLDAVHVVSFSPGYVLASEGWKIGAKVRIDVNWERRIYHMQQHTGQHLVSAVLEHKLKNDTLGWMLSQSGQPSYIDLQNPPTPEDIEYVSRRCNEIIQQATRVRIDVRLESEHERPGTLPEDYREGVIRYVTIDQLDVNPCCGTHAPSLAFLGSVFILPGVSNISGPTRYRIFFVVGAALLQYLARLHSTVKEVRLALDCGQADISERVSTLQKARKDGARREKVLKAEAIRALVMDLTGSLRDVGGAKVGHIHREDESTDIDFLTSILHVFEAPGENWLVALSSGPFLPAFGTGGCLLIAGSDQSIVKGAGDSARAKIGTRLKGGGGRGRWQGKLTGNWSAEDITALEEVLRLSMA